MEQNGLMLCTGCGIGDSLDTEAITKLAGEVGAKTTLTHNALCSPEGQTAIREAIKNESLDGLIIAACSSRAKTQELRFDGDGCVVERVSLREQVIWSHKAGEEDTQMLAEDLVRMGGAKLEKIKLPEQVEEELSSTVLIAGGGLTVIANAPNPAGQAILKDHFENGISPGGLLKAALIPTVIMFGLFMLLR